MTGTCVDIELTISTRKKTRKSATLELIYAENDSYSFHTTDN